MPSTIWKGKMNLWRNVYTYTCKLPLYLRMEREIITTSYGNAKRLKSTFFSPEVLSYFFDRNCIKTTVLIQFDYKEKESTARKQKILFTFWHFRKEFMVHVVVKVALCDATPPGWRDIFESLFSMDANPIANRLGYVLRYVQDIQVFYWYTMKWAYRLLRSALKAFVLKTEIKYCNFH
jgi:hypothetical protein